VQYLNRRLSAAMWSRVLLLWLTFGLAAVALGGVTIALGQFVQDNVRDELEAQQITFPAEDELDADERAISGLVDNAGEQLTTGNQAQIYANMIALHLRQAAERAGYPGATYATLGGTQGELRAAVAAAEEAEDDEALEDAQAELEAVTNLRNTMSTGNNLRASLFSAYGWDNVATGVTVAGVVILVLSLLFFGLFLYELRRGHLPPSEE
jgi:hypothetical protein